MSGSSVNAGAVVTGPTRGARRVAAAAERALTDGVAELGGTSLVAAPMRARRRAVVERCSAFSTKNGTHFVAAGFISGVYIELAAFRVAVTKLVARGAAELAVARDTAACRRRGRRAAAARRRRRAAHRRRDAAARRCRSAAGAGAVGAARSDSHAGLRRRVGRPYLLAARCCCRGCGSAAGSGLRAARRRAKTGRVERAGADGDDEHTTQREQKRSQAHRTRIHKRARAWPLSTARCGEEVRARVTARGGGLPRGRGRRSSSGGAARATASGGRARTPRARRRSSRSRLRWRRGRGDPRERW